jgi:hypothetical protein
MKTITQSKPKKKLSAFFDQFTDTGIKPESNAAYEPEAHERLLSSAFVSDDLGCFTKNNDELTEIKADYFHSELNRLIENGVVFEVSADGFLLYDDNRTLKTSDKEFLKLNYADVLCTIQQALLVKHLFSHSPEQFEDFAFEISERKSLMSDSNITDYELYRAAVMDVTRIWFENLLKNLF